MAMTTGRSVEEEAMHDTAVTRIAALSERQRRLLRLLAAGAPTTEVAARLGLSAQRARAEQDWLLAALGVDCRADAALLWWGSRAGARAEVGRAAAALVAATAPLPAAA
jgi:DNA-binding CsgD family transcriptional regulator